MIVGWRNPISGRTHELEDFDAFGRIMPEPVLRAMALRAQHDKRHTGDVITVTGGLSCPRKTLIHRMLPITPDPTKMWKMQRGTWLHEMVGMALGENPDWWTEENAEDKCVFEGELFGVKMSCKVDALKKDYTHLMDWKFRGDGAERWVDPQGRANDNDAAQMNMIRMLMEQATGRDLTTLEMTVWVMAGVTVRTTAPWMSEDDVGGVRPGGGQYTVREIFGQLSLGMQHWRNVGGVDDAKQEDLEAFIGKLPMVGETMYSSKRGNMCTSYCEVQDECYRCSGGI